MSPQCHPSGLGRAPVLVRPLKSQLGWDGRANWVSFRPGRTGARPNSQNPAGISRDFHPGIPGHIEGWAACQHVGMWACACGHVHLYVHVHVHVRMWACACGHVHLSICMRICMCMCMCAICACACGHVGMCMCACACACACAFATRRTPHAEQN